MDFGGWVVCLTPLPRKTEWVGSGVGGEEPKDWVGSGGEGSVEGGQQSMEGVEGKGMGGYDEGWDDGEGDEWEEWMREGGGR